MNKLRLVYLMMIILLIASLVVSKRGVKAMPASPVDESRVPHDFHPNPNWASGPFTLPDASVTITTAAGCTGNDATAEAPAGEGSVITAIDAKNSGNEYAASGKCDPQTEITGSGTSAAVKTTITRWGCRRGNSGHAGLQLQRSPALRDKVNSLAVLKKLSDSNIQR